MSYDFEIKQGTTYEQTLIWKDSTGTIIPLVDASVHMMARYNSYNGEVAFDLSTTNGKITITTEGYIQLSLTATETAALYRRPMLYDVEVTLEGKVYRILEGNISLSPEVTR